MNFALQSKVKEFCRFQFHLMRIGKLQDLMDFFLTKKILATNYSDINFLNINSFDGLQNVLLIFLIKSKDKKNLNEFFLLLETF